MRWQPISLEMYHEMLESSRDRQRSELVVEDLQVAYASEASRVLVVGGVTFEARPGEITGIAGESGSGKTTALLAAIGYLPPGATHLGGSSRLNGIDLLRLEPRQLRGIWAHRVSYVPQDAMGCLNPAFKVGSQIEETLRVNRGTTSANLQQWI